MGGGKEWKETPDVSPLLHNAMKTLEGMPKEGKGSIVLLTDATCSSLSFDKKETEALLSKMNREDVNCNVIEIATHFEPFSVLGFVADSEALQTLAANTKGCYFRLEELLPMNNVNDSSDKRETTYKNSNLDNQNEHSPSIEQERAGGGGAEEEEGEEEEKGEEDVERRERKGEEREREREREEDVERRERERESLKRSLFFSVEKLNNPIEELLNPLITCPYSLPTLFNTNCPSINHPTRIPTNSSYTISTEMLVHNNQIENIHKLTAIPNAFPWIGSPPPSTLLKSVFKEYFVSANPISFFDYKLRQAFRLLRVEKKVSVAS